MSPDRLVTKHCATNGSQIDVTDRGVTWRSSAGANLATFWPKDQFDVRVILEVTPIQADRDKAA